MRTYATFQIKQFIPLAALLLLSTQAKAEFLDAEGILRNDNGSIALVPHYLAKEACPEGMRLPTAREYAKLAESHGAEGPSDYSQVKHLPVYDYKTVRASHSTAIRPAGIDDEFYIVYQLIIHNKYRPPSGDLGKHLFWTSSWDGNLTNRRYYFDGRSGALDMVYGRTENFVAARCVFDR